MNSLSFHRVVFYAWDASFSREGGKGRSQNPHLMNKKSFWLKGDWFVSWWVAFYSALEGRGVLIDKSPPLPPHLHPGSCDPRVIKYNVQHLEFLNLWLKNRRSEFVFTEGAAKFFHRDGYFWDMLSGAAQQQSACRIYFPPDPPTPHTTTVMAFVASA